MVISAVCISSPVSGLEKVCKPGWGSDTACDWLVRSKCSHLRDFLSCSWSHLTDREREGGFQMEEGFRARWVSTLIISVPDFPHATFFFCCCCSSSEPHSSSVTLNTGLSCTLCRRQMSRTEAYPHASGSDCPGPTQQNISLFVCAVVVLNRLIKCFYRLGTYVKLEISGGSSGLPPASPPSQRSNCLSFLFWLMLTLLCTEVCLCSTLKRWENPSSPWCRPQL